MTETIRDSERTQRMVREAVGDLRRALESNLETSARTLKYVEDRRHRIADAQQESDNR